MTASSVSAEELEQILQTIEMFEVITQANPEDGQSLEILKEAYWKVGRQKDAIEVTRRLADAYFNQGQYSSALLEYEGILQRDPDSPEILARLGEVEARLQQPPPGKPRSGSSGIDVDFSSVIGGDNTLTTTGQTQGLDALDVQEFAALDDDGNEPLSKFLIQHRLAPEDGVRNAFERVQKLNLNLGGQAIAASMIDELCKAQMAELDILICGILDRTKFAYVPLENYDVDRHVVKMLPEELTLGRMMVPFDLISRTVMIALANPFDAPGKEAAQQMLDYNIQWHLAKPEAIAKVLRDAYRLDARE